MGGRNPSPWSTSAAYAPQAYVGLQRNVWKEVGRDGEVVPVLAISAYRGGAVAPRFLKFDTVGFAVIMAFRPLNLLVQGDTCWSLELVQSILNNLPF